MTSNSYSSFPTLSGDGSELPAPFIYAPGDREGVMAQKKRLAKLEAKRPAWTEFPANDNQAWPLAQWLRKDGNEVLLRVAERYRAMYDASCTEVALTGSAPDDLYNLPLDQRVHNRADGSVGYKGTRKVKGAVAQQDGDDGAYKIVPIDDDVRAEIQSGPTTFPRKPAQPVAKKWNGDRLLIEAIDSRDAIVRLQKALGPLLEPFEDAVLHGETLSAIGESRGAGGKTGGAAGRVLVMMGLEVIQREFAAMDRVAA